MSKLIPMSGLPRSGSTLLVNLLNQNPDFTISPDSLLSTIVHASQESFTNSVSESQYNSDKSYEMFYNFCRGGISNWIDSVCDTPHYIDKCRGWGHELDFLNNIFGKTGPGAGPFQPWILAGVVLTQRKDLFRPVSIPLAKATHLADLHHAASAPG